MSDGRIQARGELEVRRDLLLKYAIEQHISKLIEIGAEAVRTLKPPQGKQTSMEESQIRNLLNVAMETSSVDVITNFIRYQIGRSPEKWGKEEADFGPTLIRDIETGEVFEASKKVKEKIRHELGEEHTENSFDRAYLRLTRLYLGYMMRIFYYCKKREDAKDPKVWENLFRAKEGGKGVV